MPFVVVENPEENIWDTNPGLELITEFRDFKAKEGEIKSSNIIKAIYYIWDPKSPLRDSGLPEEKLIEDNTKNIIGDKNFNWDDYEDIKEFYLKYNISKIEALLLQYEDEVKGLNELLADWPWTKKGVKEKSFAVSQYKGLFESLMEISDKVRADASDEMEMRAGYQKTMVEMYKDE